MDYSNKHGMSRILWIVFLSALLLTGCATTKSGPAASEPETSSSQPAANSDVSFPDISDAWREQGRFIDIDHLRLMNLGLSKPEVRALLGDPHFDEGFFGVDTWNYIVKFRTGSQPEDYVVCQYQVHYDDNGLTDGLYWRDSSCADYVNDAPESKTISLDGDVLFDFDSARLSAQGQQVVANLGHRIRDNYDAPLISVVGYTDHFGSAAYNQALSQRRAETVRRALIATGIAANAVSSRGAGESNPVVYCEGTRATTAVKACLQPNRRVEIVVNSRR